MRLTILQTRVPSRYQVGEETKEQTLRASVDSYISFKKDIVTRKQFDVNNVTTDMSETMKNKSLNTTDMIMTSSLEFSATGESKIPQDVIIEALDTVQKISFNDNTKFQSKAQRYDRINDDERSVKQVQRAERNLDVWRTEDLSIRDDLPSDSS